MGDKNGALIKPSMGTFDSNNAAHIRCEDCDTCWTCNSLQCGSRRIEGKKKWCRKHRKVRAR